MVKQITKMKKKCPILAQNCNFEPFCFQLSTVWEENKCKQIEIYNLLMVLLSKPLNKLPWVKSSPPPMAGVRVLVCTFFHHLLNFFVLRMNFLFCHHSIHHYFCCCKFPFKEIQDIVWIPHPSPWKTFKASEPPTLSKRWIFTFIGNLFFVIST